MLGRIVLGACVLGLALLGCQRSPESRVSVGPASVPSSGDQPMEIQLTSAAFSPGERIPKKYSGEGEDRSPPLAWSQVPEETRELALICEDPDAPTAEPWVHWVLYKIPADLRELPEGILPEGHPSQPAGVVQGKNSWGSGQTIGYRGPMPPPGHGTHHYYFTLYALDVKLPDEPGLTQKALWQAMHDHILSRGQLMGTYAR